MKNHLSDDDVLPLEDEEKPEVLSQKSLSSKIDKRSHQQLIAQALEADKVRLECVAAKHSSAWLRAVPAKFPVNMVMEPSQFSAALKHRLGLHLNAKNSFCSSCAQRKDRPEILDNLGHHALTCKYRGYVQVRHNKLARAFAGICKRAQLNPKLEQGAEARDLSRPADVWLPNYFGAQDVALDFTVVSPLTNENISGAAPAEGRAKRAVRSAEVFKHERYDEKCAQNNWKLVPMAVDSYGVWGDEATALFDKVADNLVIQLGVRKSIAASFIYNTLGVVLARENARAILAKSPSQKLDGPDIHNLVGDGVESERADHSPGPMPVDMDFGEDAIRLLDNVFN